MNKLERANKYLENAVNYFAEQYYKAKIAVNIPDKIKEILEGNKA